MGVVSRWLTISQAAQVLGLSRQRVWVLVRSGRLRAVRASTVARERPDVARRYPYAWLIEREVLHAQGRRKRR